MNWGTPVQAIFTGLEVSGGLYRYYLSYRGRRYLDIRKEAFSFNLVPGDTVRCDRGYSGNCLVLRIRRKE